MIGDTDLSPDTRLIRCIDVLQASLGDEQRALLKTSGTHYYGVEGPGAVIWEWLEVETTISAICAKLVVEFDVTEPHCLSDTAHFVQSLISEDLVRIVDE